MTSERRKYVRLDMRLNLSYKIVGTAKLGKSLTKDISGGGIRFPAEHALEPGTQVEVMMRLPEREEPVRFTGEVVWSEPCPQADKALPGGGTEVGVRFVTIDPADRALIIQYAVFYTPPP